MKTAFGIRIIDTSCFVNITIVLMNMCRCQTTLNAQSTEYQLQSVIIPARKKSDFATEEILKELYRSQIRLAPVVTVFFFFFFFFFFLPT